MKKLLLHITIGLVLGSVSGCSKRLGTTKTSYVSDSVSTSNLINERDTVLHVKADSASTKYVVPGIERLWPQAYEKEMRSSNGQAKVTIRTVRDTIIVTAMCDSLEYKIKVRDQVIERLQQHVSDKAEVKRVPFIPKWCWWLMGIGVVSIVIHLIKLYLKFVKPI